MNWISVEDRLPDDKDGYRVLASCNDIINGWVQILHYNKKYFVMEGGREFPCIVTHWMPLPKPPKNKKETDLIKE